MNKGSEHNSLRSKLQSEYCAHHFICADTRGNLARASTANRDGRRVYPPRSAGLFSAMSNPA